jgi:hypothetical protein
MDPQQIVKEMRRVRDDLNRIRTGLAMSDMSDRDETQRVINDIDMLMSDSDELRDMMMKKAM